MVLFVEKMFRGLNSLFSRHPRLANTLTGSMIFGAGDFISQNLESVLTERKLVKIDQKRLLSVAALGACMNGLALYQWYYILDKFLGSSMKAGGVVLGKVACDQLVYAPFSISVFFFMSSIDGNLSSEASRSSSTTNFVNKLQSSFVSTYIADFCLWPMVNFINFRFIALHLRPTFVGIAQIGWQSYLSTVSFKKKKVDDTRDI